MYDMTHHIRVEIIMVRLPERYIKTYKKVGKEA